MADSLETFRRISALLCSSSRAGNTRGEENYSNFWIPYGFHQKIRRPRDDFSTGFHLVLLEGSLSLAKIRWRLLNLISLRRQKLIRSRKWYFSYRNSKDLPLILKEFNLFFIRNHVLSMAIHLLRQERRISIRCLLFVVMEGLCEAYQNRYSRLFTSKYSL